MKHGSRVAGGPRLTGETDAPEEYLLTTAGLSSARQMIDSTAAEVYNIYNTSSISPIMGSALLQPHIAPVKQASSHSGEKAGFVTALLESLARNRKIIDELAKH